MATKTKALLNSGNKVKPICLATPSPLLAPHTLINS